MKKLKRDFSSDRATKPREMTCTEILQENQRTYRKPCIEHPKNRGHNPNDQQAEEHIITNPIQTNELEPGKEELDKPSLKNINHFQALPDKMGQIEKKLIASILNILTCKEPINIQKAHQYPYCATGLLSITFQKNRSPKFGTGFLIGKNLVLTAAHIVYDTVVNIQSPATSTIYIPAPKFLGDKQEGYKARRIFVPQQFKGFTSKDFTNKLQNIHDYAVIQLETQENLQRNFGSLGYDFNWMPTYLQIIKNMSIIGFPQGKKNLKKYQGKFLASKNHLLSKQPVCGGVSGAPIVQIVSSGYFVRGLHNKEINRMFPKAVASLTLSKQMFSQLQQYFTYEVDQFDLSFSFKKYLKLVDVDILIRLLSSMNKMDAQNNRKKIKISIQNQIHGRYFCNKIIASRFDNIQQLILNEIQLGPILCKKLASAKHLRGLQSIHLNNCSIGVEECKRLAKAQWNFLQTLQLQCNRIGNKGCRVLASASEWINLQRLNLQWNHIGDLGCKQLVSAKQWRHLRVLELSNNKIKDKGCKRLASAKHWEDLQSLQLCDNKIKDEGCKYLASAPWHNLQRLSLVGNTNIGTVSRNYFGQSKYRVIF